MNFKLSFQLSDGAVLSSHVVPVLPSEEIIMVTTELLPESLHLGCNMGRPVGVDSRPLSATIL